jgi:hypothetical protein
VEVGLAKDRTARWRSMHELGVALAGWLRQQGILEDAVGNSLDSKWINRRSDPARTSRPSLDSIPDNMFSPASGIAVTLRAPVGSVTPAAATPAGSITPAAAPVVPKKPALGRPFVLALIAVVIAVITGLIVVAAGSSDTGTTRSGPSVSPASEPAQAAPPPATPAAEPEPTVRPEPVSPVPAPSAALPSSRPEPRRPATPRKKPVAPASERPPNSDLIAPY